MRFFHAHPGAFVALVAILVAAPTVAGARRTTDVVGDWSGTAKSRVVVARVGGERATAGNDVEIRGDGSWAVDDTSRGWFYTGNWSPNGRKLTWSYDANGRDELISMLESWAAAHGVTSTVDLTRLRTKGHATDGRKGKRVKVTTNAKFKIQARGKTRRGRLKITGKYRPD